jgi:hypothetical protein
MEVINSNRNLEEIAEKGYKFNLEEYFSEGWRIFRVNPGSFILYTLIVIAISAGLSLIPIVGAIASAIIGPALTAGFYLGARKVDITSRAEINDFFKSFDSILQLFLFAIVSGVLVFIGFLLLLLPGIWLAVGISFGYSLIVFTENDFWESLKASVKIISKKWFHFFALFILLGILNIFGALCLLVGLLITMPVTYCVIYAAYKDIIGFNDGHTMSTEDHLVGDTD